MVGYRFSARGTNLPYCNQERRLRKLWVLPCFRSLIWGTMHSGTVDSLAMQWPGVGGALPSGESGVPSRFDLSSKHSLLHWNGHRKADSVSVTSMFYPLSRQNELQPKWALYSC